MRTIFTIFAFVALLFTGACATSNPEYRPQPNQYYKVEASVASPGESAFEDSVDAFARMQKMMPSQETLTISWKLIPPCFKRNRPARRFGGEITIKPEGSLTSISYPLFWDKKTKTDSVEKVGNDYYANFKKDGVVHKINFTAIAGGFIEGQYFEQPAIGKYGHCGISSERNALRIVWGTHEPIRGYEPQLRDLFE